MTSSELLVLWCFGMVCLLGGLVAGYSRGYQDAKEDE